LRGKRLYDAIDRLGAIDITIQVFRHISEGRDCLSGEGARRFGGRWNLPDSFPTLYTSLTLEGAVAELARLMRRQRRTLDELLPRRICEISADLTRVLDLTAPAARASVGLSDAALRRDSLASCQRVGQAAHQLGLEAILVPSATAISDNLVIFPLSILPESSLAVSLTYTWSIPPPSA